MNDQPLCSFLIPSRNRFRGLIAAIESLRTSCPSLDFDCVIGFDDDDKSSLAMIPLLVEWSNIRIVVGKKPLAYDCICDIVTDLAAIARGQWVSMLDDDVVLRGDWATPLRSMPTTGCFVNAEKYKLEGNVHLGIGRCEGWFVPNGCWRTVGYPIGGHAKLRHPIDIQMRHILVDDNKWEQRVLPGVMYDHTNWMRGKDGK